MSTQIDSADGFVLPTEIIPYCQAGFALHWLRPRSKAPIADGWSTAPVASCDDLRATWREGYNVGVRLGEPSKVFGGFLHAIDIDIRSEDELEEAHAALRALLGDTNPESLPSVISGSGGASRHLYFVTSKPFYSRKLWVSEGKHRGRDGKWHYDWEIELFGTGKQVAMPPSIHPETLERYQWERPFDLLSATLGIVPTIPAERLSEIASETYEFEAVEPLDFKAGQLERELLSLPDARIDDYHDWVALGQALHHQFGGSDRGYRLWVETSKRSEKFDEKEMRGKWRGFGRNRRRPVTMATIRQWYIEARQQAFVDAFDDLPGELAGERVEAKQAVLGAEPDALDALGLGSAAGTDDIDPLDRPVANDEGDPLDKPIELPWYSLLDHNLDTGAVRPHLHNITLIVKNDPRCAGVPELNRFTGEIVQRKPIGRQAKKRPDAAKEPMQLKPEIWQVRDACNGTLWNDSRDNDLRRVFEAPATQGGYGIKIADRDLTAAVNMVAHQNAFHPIHEYLEEQEWDGARRIDGLFVDYLGAPDNPYSRDIARLFMLAAVARVYEPGHKFDFAIIIEGIQGKRKSTFIKTLAKNWFAELEGNFHDQKQMIELMQGAWILEIPELAGFSRGDVRTIKAFISRQVDRARLSYARRAGEFPRQCVFIGSTNDSKYLRDDSGARRWWPVHCEVGAIDIAKLARNVDQLWAEALAGYRDMRKAQPHGTLPFYLTDDDAIRESLDLQESRTVESPEQIMAGQIEAWADSPIRTGDIDEDGDEEIRQVICNKEIWVECFGRPKSDCDQRMSQMIGRAMELLPNWQPRSAQKTKLYGKQRVYVRAFEAAAAA